MPKNEKTKKIKVEIEVDPTPFIKFMRQWANSRKPDKVAFYIPDGQTGGLTARQYVDMLEKGIGYGPGMLKGLIETILENLLPQFIESELKGKKKKKKK